jgi:hypothetical protein
MAARKSSDRSSRPRPEGQRQNPPDWFERILQTYRIKLTRDSPEFDSLSDREKDALVVAWRKKVGRAWVAVEPLDLDPDFELASPVTTSAGPMRLPPRTADLIGCCWDYAFARLQGSKRGSRRGADEKEWRREALQLANDAHALAKRIKTLESPPLSWMLSDALFELRGVDQRYRYPNLGIFLQSLAARIKTCLNSRADPRKKLESQAQIWAEMRRCALLGPQRGNGNLGRAEGREGMLTLATDRAGKVRYEALVCILRVLHPELSELTTQDLRREAERRRNSEK